MQSPSTDLPCPKAAGRFAVLRRCPASKMAGRPLRFASGTSFGRFAASPISETLRSERAVTYAMMVTAPPLVPRGKRHGLLPYGKRHGDHALRQCPASKMAGRPTPLRFGDSRWSLRSLAELMARPLAALPNCSRTLRRWRDLWQPCTV